MLRYSARTQNLPAFKASCPSFKEIKVLDDGTTQEIIVPANKPLPPAETLHIKNLIDAGVPLKQVNSKVLQPDYSEFVNSDFIDYLVEDFGRNNKKDVPNE